MSRKLLSYEKSLAANFTIQLCFKLSSPSFVPLITKQLLERIPSFHLSIENDYLIQSEVEPILTIPPNLSTIEDITKWISTINLKNLAVMACKEDFIAVNINHACIDGHLLKEIISTLGKDMNGFEYPSYFSIKDLFHIKITHPVQQTDPNDYFSYCFSNENRSTRGELNTIHFRIPIQELSSFDPSVNNVHKFSEHIWASIIVSSMLHKYRLTGNLSCDETVVKTIYNLRPYISPEINQFQLPALMIRWLSTLPRKMKLDDNLSEITSLLRESYQTQLDQKVQFASMLEKIEESNIHSSLPKDKSVCTLSQLGAAHLNHPIEDFQRSISLKNGSANENIFFLVYSNYSSKKGEIIGQLRHITSFISTNDAELIVKDISNSLKSNKLEMKLIDAL
jgi:hypothetical protein